MLWFYRTLIDHRYCFDTESCYWQTEYLKEHWIVLLTEGNFYYTFITDRISLYISYFVWKKCYQQTNKHTNSNFIDIDSNFLYVLVNQKILFSGFNFIYMKTVPMTCEDVKAKTMKKRKGHCVTTLVINNTLHNLLFNLLSNLWHIE